MALLDVTELLTDPDFATTFDVTRSVETVSNLGMNQRADTVTSGVVGVVEPANSMDLQRLPDLERFSGAITIWTTFRLYDADLILWPTPGGNQYTVDLLDEWTQFGAGYVKATCRRTSVP